MTGLEAEVLCIRHVDARVGSVGFFASDMRMPGLEAEVLCIRHVDAWVRSRGFVYQTCG